MADPIREPTLEEKIAKLIAELELGNALVERIDALEARIAQLEYPQGRGGILPSWCKRCGWEIDGGSHLSDTPGASWDDRRRFLPCSLCGRGAP